MESNEAGYFNYMVMKPTDKVELDKLVKRVVALKNHLHGEGNWSKNLIPKTIEGCMAFITYCDKEYGVLG